VQDKVDYVLNQPQFRDHHCHWPGCPEQVPPAKWGCKKHWFMLPKVLRDKIWEMYEPGQEITLTPSSGYLEVAHEVQKWIKQHLEEKSDFSKLMHESQSLYDLENLEVEPVIRYINHLDDVPSTISGDTLYIDIETYGEDPNNSNSALDVLTATPRLLSVYNGNGIVYIFDLLFLHRYKAIDLLRDKTLVGHNLSFDLTILHRCGLPLPAKCRDTMLESMLILAGLPEEFGGSQLKECLKRYCGIEIDKGFATSDWRDPNLSVEQIEYAANDVQYLAQLDAELSQRLEKWGLTTIADLENGLLPAIVYMTLRGIRVDVEEWRQRSRAAAAEAKRLGEAIHAELPKPDPLPEKVVRYKKDGSPYITDVNYNERIREQNRNLTWNLGSPIQVLDVFNRLGINIRDTRYETLVAKRLDYPIVDSFLRWREKEKESTTFGEAWLNHLKGDRVHPNWRQLGAQRSGRMSCSDPNMQQLPRGNCRKGIIASEGCLLVRADFSQIEARIAAKISGDEVLTELFNKGGDIHRYTAKAVLQKENVTAEDRQIGKSLLFGLLFSMSAPHLQVYCATNYGVKLSNAEAVIFRDRFFRTFPGLARWHNRMRNICEGKKEFRSLLGRRRLVGWGNENVNMLGLALNHPVQGSAADLIKMSAREVWERRDEMPEAKLLMLVHDEIVMEAPEDKAKVVGEWLRGIMIEAGNVILDPIPVDAEVKIGRSWGG